MSPRSSGHTPRVAEFILSRLHDYSQCYGMLYDMREVHASLCLTQGRRRADLWYWRQCLGALPKYLSYCLTWRTTMLRNHLKIGLRNLCRNRSFGIINILGLAVGMACTILILLWVQHETSYEDFNPHADDIYLIAWERLANNRYYSTTPFPLAERLEAEFSDFSQIVRINPRERHIVKYMDKIFIEERTIAADPSLFAMFPYPFLLGEPEKALVDPNTIVLTESTAQKYFSDEVPLGMLLEVDGVPLKVCGVIRDVPVNSEIRFDLITRFNDLKQVREYQDPLRWNNFSYHTYVQVKPGLNTLDINPRLTEAMDRYRSWLPPGERDFFLFPLKKLHLYELEGGGLIRYVYLFSFAAIFILVISCINFVNLSTAQSAQRAKEVGIRRVIGSDRRLLMRQFMGESFLYVLFSFSIALVLILLSLPAFNALVQKNLRFGFQDVRFILGLLAIFLMTVVLAGSYPSFYLSAHQPVKTLRGGARVRGQGRFRQILVVIQFVISILLIICTFVVLKQIRFMKHADLGFNEENLLSLPLTQTMSTQAQSIKARLMQHPSIENVTASAPTNHGGRFSWEGMDPELSYLGNEVQYKMVDYDYFDTLGAEIVAGRSFLRERSIDFQDGFIINQEAAKLMRLESPVDKALNIVGWDGSIIGVVNNIHVGYKDTVHVEVYYLRPRTPWDLYATLDVRIKAGEIPSAMASIKEVWKVFNPDRPFEYTFHDAEIGRKYRQEEQASLIFGYFAFLSIFLSCLGLSGLVGYTTEQRTKEIGIRKILGAPSTCIVALLNKDNFRSLLLANVLAWPLGWLVMREWLQAYPYRTRLDIGTFVAAAALTTLIALLTISVQAVRAATSDPVSALRHE